VNGLDELVFLGVTLLPVWILLGGAALDRVDEERRGDVVVGLIVIFACGTLGTGAWLTVLDPK
jgi:hypothetical protein